MKPSSCLGRARFRPLPRPGRSRLRSLSGYVEALERGGADVIELGVPFWEPIAEGTTIQSAIVRALESGMTPERYFEFVEGLDGDVNLVCMTDDNLVFQYGDESGPRPFVERAAEVGIEGFVVVDLPAREADPLRDACDEFCPDLVLIVVPTTACGACASASPGTLAFGCLHRETGCSCL